MKRILFVDDEMKVLEGIERLLFPYSDDWDMVFVGSGDEALTRLALDPFDIIVTDLRMPGMDGADLLLEVQKRHPDIVRFVLSGHGELEQGLRVLPVAHQFLGKPCKPEVLCGALERACGLRERLADPALRALASDAGQLPARPTIFGRLLTALAKEDTTLADIATIVEDDIVISSRLLQIVNSAFFGSTRRITTANDAVMRLGTNAVQSLVLALSAYRDEKEPKIRGFSVDAVHEHGLRVGALARRLVDDDALRDDALMAGMIHDIGKLTLAYGLPDYLQGVIAEAAKQKRPMWQIELEQRGSTHADIGAYLASLWGMPYPVIEAVANHHAETLPGGCAVDLTAAVCMADLLVGEAEGRALATATLEPLAEKSGWSNRLEKWRTFAQPTE